MLTYPVNNPFRSPLISAFYIRAFGALPPDFTDDLTNPSTLLSYWDGTNASPTTKKDLINGYDIVAVEGPCLTLEVGDTVLLPMDDSLASTLGTGTLTYDGLNFAVTVGGTFYKLLTTGGKEFPLSEGAGTTFRDTTGKYEGEITAASPATMWTDNTQDDYFSAMDKGYYVKDIDDGGQYPYDPDLTAYFNMRLGIAGGGSITIDGTAYTAGDYALENLFGTVDMAALLGANEARVTWSSKTDDVVAGAYPDFSTVMDQHKEFTATFTINDVMGEFTALMGITGVVGGTFDFGTDASPNFHMQVTSRSWTTAGVETTKVRTVYGKKVRRKPYPDQLVNEEVQNGSKVDVQVILNDFIYADDVITDVTYEAGLFTDTGAGGTGLANPLIVNAAAQNNSADTYPTPIATWGMADLGRAETTTYNVRLAVAHRHYQDARMVQCVEFIATDETGNSVSTFSTVMTPVTYTASGLTAPYFQADIDLTTLNQSEMVTVDAKIYPFIGDVWQASVDGAVYPSPNMTVIKFLNDKLGTYGTAYAYVDGVGGTPAVNEDAATAQTTPYATVAEAAVAIQTYNNTTFARNSASGGVIRLEAGTHVHSDYGAVLTTTIPLIMEGVDQVNSIYKDAGVSTTTSIPLLSMFKNMTIDKTSDVILFDTGAGIATENLLVVDSCIFSNSSGSEYAAWFYKTGMTTFINCSGEQCGQSDAFSTVSKQVNIIGCYGFIGTAVYSHIASKTLTERLTDETLFGLYRQPPDGVMAYFSYIGQGVNAVKCIEYANTILSLAIVGVVAEQYGGTTGPALFVSADGSTDQARNIVLAGNTVAGSRANTLYQDVNGSGYVLKDGINSDSVFYLQNIKSDIFSADGNNIGNWSSVNRVGSRRLVAVSGGSDGETQGTPGAWLGEVIADGDLAGTGATPIVTAWSDDQSFTVGGVGNGDYRPIAGTTELPQIPAGKTAFPYDHMGQVVPIDGTAYVGALQAV